MNKKILVAGATGNLGERIVKALVKRGAQVRVLNRKETDPAKTKKLTELGAEVISVDMSDAQELKRACQDVSCVVSLIFSQCSQCYLHCLLQLLRISNKVC